MPKKNNHRGGKKRSREDEAEQCGVGSSAGDMKRSRETEAEEPTISEASVGIVAHVSDALPQHPTGIFQCRWADFHVRELAEDGTPHKLTEVPSSDAVQADMISFIMCKENRTTADALLQLASASGIPLNAFSVAGSKDRRAVTVQQVTARGVRDANKLLRVNEKWRANGSRVRVGHLKAADKALDLSSACGNHFVIVLREVALRGSDAADEPTLRAACDAAVTNVRSRGFVNFFGLQRFGHSAHVPTHAVGGAILQREYVRALQLVLSPHAPGLKPSAAAALELFAQDAGAARLARSRLPTRGCALAYKLLCAFIAEAAAVELPSSAASEGAAPKQPLAAADKSDQPLAAATGTEQPLAAATGTDPPLAAATRTDQPLAAADGRADQPSQAGGAAPSAINEAGQRACAALRLLPRRQLLLYVNALQGYAFNRAASHRLTHLDANAPVAGDLVWQEAPCAGAGAGGEQDAATDGKELEPLQEDGGAEGDDVEDAAGASLGDAEAGTTGRARVRATLPPAVHVLTSAEAASGRYSMRDVLLPLPGHAVTYPGHSATAEYRTALAEHGVALPAEDAVHEALWYYPELFDLPGCYRPLLAYPTDMSADVLAYTDHTATLEPSDLDALEPRPNEAPHAPAASGVAPDAPAALADTPVALPDTSAAVPDASAASSVAANAPPAPTRWAWRLRFSLPASAYATCLLREILHEGVEGDEHTRRAKEVARMHREQQRVQ